MSRVATEVQNLKKRDIYSLMLFALYKLRDIPEYSSLSELAYILDKDNLLKLCEYFGGMTLTIPTIDELESILYSLLLYEYVDVEKMSYNDAIKLIGHTPDELRKIKADYHKIVEILEEYSFERG